jgi:uncharacterized protein YndB with AHSA1/START domain
MTIPSESPKPNSARFHRVLKASPDKVYRAFLDADAKVKWLPPNGFTCKVHHLDATVGGSYKMSFTNFGTGRSHSWTGQFVELTPHERIRYTDRFDDPNLPGEMMTTVTLRKVFCGSDLSIVQEGISDVNPPEACCLGWQESLVLLAKLVEADIPDKRWRREPHKREPPTLQAEGLGSNGERGRQPPDSRIARSESGG